MHALLALEKFSKTGADNARRVSEVNDHIACVRA
jgi:hypothetical protein